MQAVQSSQRNSVYTYSVVHGYTGTTPIIYIQLPWARSTDPDVENQNHQRKLLYDRVDKNNHKMHYRPSLDYRGIALSWVSRSEF